MDLRLFGPGGDRIAKALIDCGADGNFVSRMLAKELQIEPTETAGTQYATLNGQRLFVAGQSRSRFKVCDSKGQERGCVADLVHGDIHGYDIVLGMPWLEQWNPAVDFVEKTIQWGSQKRRKRRNVATIGPVGFSGCLKDTTTQSFALSVRLVEQTGPEDARMVASAGEVTSAESGVPEALQRHLDTYSQVFSEEEAAELADHGPHDLAIDLVDGAQAPWGPLYPLSQAELAVLQEYLRSNMQKGYIRPSKSPAGAPILFAKKKDGTLRLCVDYRALNALTVKNRHPLPLIQESLDQLTTGRYFSKLDMRDAYHRVRIKPGDEWKTAFRTRYGHFEYTVMPFGLSNAPASFQSYINNALAGLLDHICVVYLDDILIYSQTEEEHIEHIRLVLERLRIHKLYAKRSKCEFLRDSVDFLGFVIGREGVSVEPDRIRSIQEWPLPASVRDIRVFIGFANYYRRFIKGFSRVTAPLNRYTEGKKAGKRREEAARITLSAEAIHAFKSLQALFQTAPVLRHFDPELPIRVQTDASGYAVSGVLSQPYEFDGKLQWYPVAFFSKKMTGAERNYDTYDGELLAVVATFKHFRHYLEGAQHQVELLTDHANLQWFMTTKALTRRQVRWAEWLSIFDFRIHHTPGKDNGAADALSRRPDYEEELHSGRWNSEGDAAPSLAFL